jgi:hypothetical protein
LPQTVKWGPLGPLLANLTPTKHVQAVEVNKIQQQNIYETYIIKYTKNNVRHATKFSSISSHAYLCKIKLIGPPKPLSLATLHLQSMYKQ